MSYWIISIDNILYRFSLILRKEKENYFILLPGQKKETSTQIPTFPTHHFGLKLRSERFVGFECLSVEMCTTICSFFYWIKLHHPDVFKAQTLRVWLILDRSRLAFLLHIADRHRANEIIILPANVNLMVSEQMNHRKMHFTRRI